MGEPEAKHCPCGALIAFDRRYGPAHHRRRVYCSRECAHSGPHLPLPRKLTAPVCVVLYLHRLEASVECPVSTSASLSRLKAELTLGRFGPVTVLAIEPWPSS